MAEAAGNPPEKEGERPMVKRRNATDPDETMGAQMEVTTAVEMETMSLAGADDPRPHHDATNLQRGQCLAHSGSVRGKKSKPPLYLERQRTCSYGLIQSPMLSRRALSTLRRHLSGSHERRTTMSTLMNLV